MRKDPLPFENIS